MLSKKFLQVISVVLLSLIIANAANAQFRRRRPRNRKQASQQVSVLGVRFGSDFKHDQLLVGAHLWLPAGRFWKLAPGFDYYFAKEMTRWQFNGDIIFKPHPRHAFYLGGGLAVDYAKPEAGEFETNLGGNALVGLEVGGRGFRSLKPYIQARWTFYENDTFFSFLGGLNLALR